MGSCKFIIVFILLFITTIKADNQMYIKVDVPKDIELEIKEEPIVILNNYDTINPFNIKKNKNYVWIGVDTIKVNKTKFVNFETEYHGLRAGFIILRTYTLKHKILSTEKIINRFCPDANLSYINGSLAICDTVKNKEDIIQLAQHMLRMERGVNYEIDMLTNIYDKVW